MTDLSPETKARVEQLRQDVQEMVKRRQRGLPAYRGDGAPPPAALDVERVRTLLGEGRSSMAAGRYADALTRADTAIGLAAADELLRAEAWALAGQARLHQGNLQTARAAFNKSLVDNPANIEARIGLCRTYRRIGQPERAVPLYVETVPLIVESGERSALIGELADAYRAMGRPDLAMRALRQDQVTLTDEVTEITKSLLLPQDLIGWLMIVTGIAIVAYFGYARGLPRGSLIALAAVVVLLYLALQLLRQTRR